MNLEIEAPSLAEDEVETERNLGMRAFCLKRNEERVFGVSRILEIEQA